MSKISAAFQNPYSSRARRKQAANTFTAGQVDTYSNNNGAPLSLHELRTHLQNTLNGKESKYEAEFKQYLDHGYSYGYLDDKTVQNDLFKLMAKDIKANTDTLFNSSSSILFEYIERLGFPDDSIQKQVFKFIEAAKDHKGDEPLVLTDDHEGYSELRNLITDPVKNLSVHASSLQELQKSDNPAFRFLYTAAIEMGLAKSIDKTNKDLRAGKHSKHSESLADNVDDILIKEAKFLDDILDSDGSMAYKIADGGRYYIEAPKITTGMAKLINGEDRGGHKAGGKFNDGQEFSFSEFFKEAHRLSILADAKDGQTKLRSHIADGLGWLNTYYSAARRVATTDDDKKFINEQFLALSESIKGRALLPKRISSIVQDAANLSIFSQEFAESFSSHNNTIIENETLKHSIELYFDAGEDSKPGLQGILTSNGEITVPTDDGKVQKHKIAWIEDADIRDGAAANKNLDYGAPISLERAVRAYNDTVDKTAQETLKTVQRSLPNELSNKGLRDETLHQIHTQIDSVRSTANLKEAFKDGLEELVQNDLVKRDQKQVSKALQKYTEGLLNKYLKADQIWLTQENEETFLAYQLNLLTTKIISNENIQEDADLFMNELFAYIKPEYQALFTDNKALDKSKNFFSTITAEAQSAPSFDSILDLQDGPIKSLFDSRTAIGRSFSNALEDLNLEDLSTEQMFQYKYPQAQEVGELINLLKAEYNGTIDHGKRIAALSFLIGHLATNSSFDEETLLEYVSDSLSSNQANKLLAKEALKQTLHSGLDLEEKLLMAQRRAVTFTNALHITQRLTFQRKDQDTQRAISYFGNQNKFDTELKPSLININDKIDIVLTTMEDSRKPLDELNRLLDNDTNALAIVDQFCRKDPNRDSSLGEDIHQTLTNLQIMINSLV